MGRELKFDEPEEKVEKKHSSSKQLPKISIDLSPIKTLLLGISKFFSLKLVAIVAVLIFAFFLVSNSSKAASLVSPLFSKIISYTKTLSTTAIKIPHLTTSHVKISTTPMPTKQQSEAKNITNTPVPTVEPTAQSNDQQTSSQTNDNSSSDNNSDNSTNTGNQSNDSNQSTSNNQSGTNGSGNSTSTTTNCNNGKCTKVTCVNGNCTTETYNQ